MRAPWKTSWIVIAAGLAACVGGPKSRPSATCTAVVGATVIAAPDAEPLRPGVVVWCGGVLQQVGPAATVTVPAGATVLEAPGATVVAGFWNTHVHFTERAFAEAASTPAAQLEPALDELATRWGFVHVVDLGSDPANTAALARRLASGDLRGPSVHRAAGPFIAEHAQPVYVPVPLPELRSVAQARAVAQAVLDEGADAVKLMTASVVAHPPSPVLPVEVVRAVTEVAHARGKLVFAHPTNEAGVEAARLGGVDVLAHTDPEDGPWSAGRAQQLVAAGLALVPTLSLWRYELAERPAIAQRFEAAAVEQVRAFHAAGGTLLFGTDTGYRPEHDPAAELALLTRAGLSWREQLAMLTTGPASRFQVHTGRLAPGWDADVVLLSADPSVDPAALGHVQLVVRGGRVISAPPSRQAPTRQ